MQTKDIATHEEEKRHYLEQWQAVLAHSTDRNDVIKTIRRSLKERSGKAWSVTGGRGTAWGWINIRAMSVSWMSDEQCAELAGLLGLNRVHPQGESVPASTAYRQVALSRAMFGHSGAFSAEPYWD